MRIAFDIIGSRERAVAIVELKKGQKPKAVAKELMERYPHVKAVLAKAGPREGVLRIYKLKLISGSKNTVVTHKEHGLLFKMDPKLMYFSPRESTERQRIAEMVKPNERVLVMFSGVGPFAFAIAKQQPTAEIACVEINKDAVDFANENVKLNGAWNVKNYCADAHDSAKLGQFDRIIMPLPETAYKFLPAAFRAAKRNAIIHLYGISRQNGLDLAHKAEMAAKRANVKIRILAVHKVLPYAPRTWKMRLDIRLL